MEPYQLIATVRTLIAESEKRIIAAVSKRKPEIPRGAFVKRPEAIQLLATRSVLESCEKSGWITACTRQRKLVLYLRQEVMAAVHRISQGEFPQ
jgi:hypothetical protein